MDKALNYKVVCKEWFDPETMEPQELYSREFHKMVAADPVNFPPPPPEAFEPRYKTRMSSSEFVRDLITIVEWNAIGELIQNNPELWAWCETTKAGDAWGEHPDFEKGLYWY